MYDVYVYVYYKWIGYGCQGNGGSLSRLRGFLWLTFIMRSAGLYGRHFMADDSWPTESGGQASALRWT